MEAVRKRDREKESDRRYIKRESVGNRWRQCKRERRERGDIEVGAGKIESKGKERGRDGWKQLDRELKRERREKEIYKERQGGGGNRWWACEREREGERGDREREMEERNRKGEREKKEDRQTHRHT